MGIATPNYREAGQMLSAYGQRLGVEGDDAGAQQAFATAMAIAKHEGDATLEIETLIDASWVDVFHLRLQESGEKSLRAQELMERLGAPHVRGWEALLHVLRVHYNAGDLGEARRYATRLLTFAESLENSGILAGALYGCEKIAALSGDWTNARQFCDRGLSADPKHDFIMQVRVLLEYAVGEFDEGEAFLGRLIEVYHTAGPEPDWVHLAITQIIAVIAHTTGTTKHIDVAQSAAQTVLKSHRVHPLMVWVAHTSLALIAAQTGDTMSVQEHYRALQGKRGNFGVIDVDRLLGILAAASGELDEAAAYFEAALTTWGKGRYPEYAWTAYEYADMLLQRGNSGDQARVASLLDNALTISHELGMVPLTERVLLRQESVNMQ